MAAEARKAVIKHADMIDTLQHDAIDTATAVHCVYFSLYSQCIQMWNVVSIKLCSAHTADFNVRC